MSYLKKVIFISNWFDNPYKKLMIEHLNKQGMEIEEYQWSMFFISKIFKTERIDIIHFHTIHDFIVARNIFFMGIKFLIFISQIILLKLMNIKMVWTVHEWSDKICDGKHDIPQIYAAIIGYLFDGIITHCESTKEEIATALNLQHKDKVFVVYHGNYIEFYPNKITQAEARKTLNIPNENRVFLFFGGIYRSKGTLEAIASFKNLTQDKINLIIVGKPGEKGIKDTILETIEGYENILFVPQQVADEEVQIYLNACDCVLLPYKIFTTSGVALLAMSYEKVCIAPCTGFFKDILSDGGAFLYNSKEENGLFDAMKLALFNQEKLADMGKNNLEMAKQWNWDYVAEKTSKVYQYCLEN